MAVLAFVSDLRQTVAITSLSLLSTHIILHVSAIRLRKKVPDLKTFKAPFYPLIPSLGLIGSIILMFSLPVEAWFLQPEKYLTLYFFDTLMIPLHLHLGYYLCRE